MFGKKDIEYSYETTNFDEVRDYMEYAHQHGYAFKYEDKYAIDMHYYKLTIGLSRSDVEYLAKEALITEAVEFHEERNKERKAEYEDARRDGYAQAVEDMAHDRKG